MLVKSISETRRRNVAEVLREFSAYDVWLVHIYRDPVNVFVSRRTKWPQAEEPGEFVPLWNRRNKTMLSVWKDGTVKAANVNYEDLVDDPHVFRELRNLTDVRGKYVFEGDSNRGRQSLPRESVKQIDEGTRSVRDELDARRTYVIWPNVFKHRLGRPTKLVAEAYVAIPDGIAVGA